MTTKAYCLYCYECLSASFENRENPSLEHVVQLYDEYTAETEKRKDEAAKDAEDATEDVEDEEDTSGSAQPTHPSISRLQSSGRNSSSRSSFTSASTPSVLSANSSQSQLPSNLTSSTSIESTRSTYASRLSLTASYPLFVTWNTISRSGTKTLRGCIGTFDALPLSTGLQTYALTSAFDDTRFSPIPASLLPSLSCNLTLLADFEPTKDALDWTLGTHGLRISFTYRNRRHGATYLPDVAVEQGWSKEECVESLMRKAGWDGGSGRGFSKRLLRGGDGGEGKKPWESEGVSEFRTVRYTGLMSSADYEDWNRFRSWVDGKA
jgi:uncharacterized protein (TIGR00296 family)